MPSIRFVSYSAHDPKQDHVSPTVKCEISAQESKYSQRQAIITNIDRVSSTSITVELIHPTIDVIGLLLQVIGSKQLDFFL